MLLFYTVTDIIGIIHFYEFLWKNYGGNANKGRGEHLENIICVVSSNLLLRESCEWSVLFSSVFF